MNEKSKTERINKYIAAAGVCSRREAERLITAGRVRVNGDVLKELGYKVSPEDRVEVDGTPIKVKKGLRVFVYHKPAGQVTTNRDEKGRETVFDGLPAELPRVVSVGRLDMNTEGLLIFTTSGELARALELPSKGWVRQYRARVHGRVSNDKIARLAKGITYEGVRYGSIEASVDTTSGSNTWLTMKLTEGKNREIRNVMEALDLQVSRLIRTAYGPFQLGQMERGAVKEITGRVLRDMLPKEFSDQL
jgi:23S rRNA pseudouridine2605 synthase|tara:strand:- start:88 stop:831 length:744 start_codon:yes stop_codon:yes gene_type:complete